MNGGDALARGAKSATFPASEGKITQERWDEIFKDWDPPKQKSVSDPSDQSNTSQ